MLLKRAANRSPYYLYDMTLNIIRVIYLVIALIYVSLCSLAKKQIENNPNYFSRIEIIVIVIASIIVPFLLIYGYAKLYKKYKDKKSN